jgi:hypothetical protein
MAYAHEMKSSAHLNFNKERDCLIHTLYALHQSVTDPRWAPQSVDSLRDFAEDLILFNIWNKVNLKRLIDDDCQDWWKLMGELRRSSLQEFSKEELGLG